MTADASGPSWRRMDAKTGRDVSEEWLRAMTIMADGGDRPLGELLAEIARVNSPVPLQVTLVTPLTPGESRDLAEAIGAQNRLRQRETTMHAIVTQVLLGWCATASGQTTSQVLQRLALALSDCFDRSEPSPQQSLSSWLSESEAPPGQ